MWIPIVAGLFVVIVIYLVSNASKPKKLNQKFDNIIEWKVGDTIKYEKESYRNYRVRKNKLAMFDTMGIYVVSDRMFDEFMKNKEKGTAHKMSEFMHFIRTREIQKNVTLEKRKKQMKLKDKLYNSHSYHNTLTSMQEEFDKIMEEDRKDNINRVNS